MNLYGVSLWLEVGSTTLLDSKMNWKRIGLMLVACPAGALLGGCITGLLLANPINLFVRAALERKAMSAGTADVLVPLILAVAASGGGAGFVLAGRKVGQQGHGTVILLGYFLVVSLVLLLPEITTQPIPNLSIWFGFIVGGLTGITRRNKRLSNQASEAISEPAPKQNNNFANKPPNHRSSSAPVVGDR